MDKENRKIKTRIDKDRELKKVGEPGRFRARQEQRVGGYGPLFTSALGHSGLGLFFNGLMVQAKLQVGEAGDQYEREADRVADELVTNDSSTPTLQTAVTRVQAKGSPNGKWMAGKVESEVKSMPGGGRSLDRETRAYFEPRFGVDLGNVKIHTGNKADRMAKTLNARALTYGNNIAFAGGHYSPNTLEGKKLIAHELTHVLQQAGETVQRAPAKGKPPVEERVVDRYPYGFDPAKEARRLHEALEDGWGADERTVLDILTTGSEHMLSDIKTAYNITYKTSLNEKISEQLSGSALRRARLLLKNGGELTLLDKIREVLRDFIIKGRLNSEKLYHDLQKATDSERGEVLKNKKVMFALITFLPPDELYYVYAFLKEGKGILAAQLLDAFKLFTDDEELIWRSIKQATEEERKFIKKHNKLKLLARIKLRKVEYEKFLRLLDGSFTTLDEINVATLGWGTDPAALLAALQKMTASDLQNIKGGAIKGVKSVADLKELLVSELSGADLEEAQQLLHQKQMAFDARYKEQYMAKMPEVGENEDPAGRSVLNSRSKEKALSPIDELKVAAAGAGTDKKKIWHVLNSLTRAQGKYLLQNPEGILDTLYSDLSEEDFKKAVIIMNGGVHSVIATLKEAIGFFSDDERLVYDTIDRIIRENLSKTILKNKSIMEMLESNLSGEQYKLFKSALEKGGLSPMDRLRWATTADSGTDEELVYELCAEHKAKWYKNSQVEEILGSELKKRDYWKAMDIMRPDAESEEERIDIARENLDRERGGFSSWIMDKFSDSGQNAEDSFRDYKSGYNSSIADGKVTADEEKEIRLDEEYSKAMTEEYRATKNSISNWASSIAVAVVGAVVTILTCGAGAPLVVALGGKVLVAAQAMVGAAILKVGINKAIQGEGYDLESTDALVDAISASVEIGLNAVGGQVASRFMQGLGKSAMIKTVAPSIQKSFGKAGSQILKEGLETGIEGALSGASEGAVRSLSREETWAKGVNGFLLNLGQEVSLNAALSGASSFSSATLFKTVAKGLAPSTATAGQAQRAPGQAKGPIKRQGGNLDESASKARTQPYPDNSGRVIPQKQQAQALDKVDIKRNVDKELLKHSETFADELKKTGADLGKLSKKVVERVTKELDKMAKKGEALTVEGVDYLIEAISSKEFNDFIASLSATSMKVAAVEQYVSPSAQAESGESLTAEEKKAALSAQEAEFLKSRLTHKKFGSYDAFLKAMKAQGSEDQLIYIVNRLNSLSTDRALNKYDHFSIVTRRLGGFDAFTEMTFRLKGIDNVVKVIEAFGGIDDYCNYLKNGGNIDSVIALLTKLESFNQLERLLAIESNFNRLAKYIETNVGEDKITGTGQLLELLEEFGGLAKLEEGIETFHGLSHFIYVKTQLNRAGLSPAVIIKRGLAPTVNGLGIESFIEAASTIGLSDLQRAVTVIHPAVCKALMSTISCGNFKMIIKTVGLEDFTIILNRLGPQTVIKELTAKPDSINSFIKSVTGLGAEGYLRARQDREQRKSERIKKEGGTT